MASLPYIWLGRISLMWLLSSTDENLLYLRSSQYTNGGYSVEAVAAHQVRNVILDLHLLTAEPGSLKQLSFHRVAILQSNIIIQVIFVGTFCHST